ncbi:TonB-dependent receptor [Cesiribacter sp. SM1]|uniref:TonB-dependent receptor n=1 Tax=Cesiribacter sp. SM1 TaxID=2861196 RepID=UPI001CD67118|nr:TonB-dependent receptor [Cesiribacter sp. SM1]
MKEYIGTTISWMFKKNRLFVSMLGFILLVLAALPLAAQQQKPKCITDCSCDMAGRVVDQLTQEPLPFATVQLKGSSVGTIADDEGVFHLHNLCDDEFDLVVSFVGYKPVTHHHDLYHNDPVIYLSPEEAQLESIVVEGRQMESGMASVTATTIGPEELENSQGERLGNLLSRLSGVTTLSTGQNVVKPVIHGLHSSRILIINNGIRHESQNWGAEHAPEIDPSQVSNISLIKGAASVKYGPGALGGVIVVNPPQPQLTAPLSGRAGLRLQSNGRAAGGTLLLQEGYSNFAWLAQASGLFQGDLHTPDYNLTNTGARELSFSAGALYHRRQLDLRAHYSYFQQKLGILRGSVVGSLNDLAFAINNEPPAYTSGFSYNINTPNQEVLHHLLKLDGSYTFHNSSLDFQYGFQLNERQEYDVRRGTNNQLPSINLQLLTHSFEADWNHPAIGNLKGSAGVQLQLQDNNNIAGTNTTPFLPNYNNLNLGAYLAESIQAGETIFDLGVRFDIQQSSVRGRDQNQDIFRHELNYSSITASTGFLKPMNNWSTIQSNLGLAWRPPNMAELYSYGKHETVIEYGLLRFHEGVSGVFSQAERAANSELSYKWVNTYSYQRNGTTAELTAYVNYLQNYIYSKPAGITVISRGPFPFFIYDQTNALLAGVDGSFALQHNNLWESALRFSFLYATDVKNNERFLGLPANRIAYTLAYKQARLGKFSNFTAGLEPSYTFRQYLAPPVITPAQLLESAGDDTEIFATAENGFDLMAAPEGYFLLNLAGSIEKGKLTYGLEVRNLLNTSYRDYTNRLRYFADEPGRNFVVSVKYNF